MLTITSPGTTAPLSTTAALRDVLGTTSTEQDAYQEALLKRATAWAETYVGYPLRMQGYTETVAGYGGYWLLLARRPVRQVVRVFDSTATSAGTEITSTEYKVESGTGRLWRYEGWPWTVARGRSPVGGFALDPVEAPAIPYGEVPSYLVEYSAGYVGEQGTTSTWDGTTSTGQTLPDDVKSAILAKAAEWATHGAMGGPDVVSKRVGDLSLSYGNAGMGGVSSMGLAESLLGPYRSIV